MDGQQQQSVEVEHGSIKPFQVDYGHWMQIKNDVLPILEKHKDANSLASDLLDSLKASENNVIQVQTNRPETQGSLNYDLAVKLFNDNSDVLGSVRESVYLIVAQQCINTMGSRIDVSLIGLKERLEKGMVDPDKIDRHLRALEIAVEEEGNIDFVRALKQKLSGFEETNYSQHSNLGKALTAFDILPSRISSLTTDKAVFSDSIVAQLRNLNLMDRVDRLQGWAMQHGDNSSDNPSD